MFHVRQQELWDCGIAVAAMIAGVGYDEVIERWREKRAVYPVELVALLVDLTQSQWRLKFRKPASSWRLLPGPEWPVAGVLESGGTLKHYIVIKRTIIHDPLLTEPVFQHQYSCGGACLRFLIEPCDPTAFAARSLHRRAQVLAELSDELAMSIQHRG
jgi:hypothetical protein